MAVLKHCENKQMCCVGILSFVLELTNKRTYFLNIHYNTLLCFSITVPLHAEVGVYSDECEVFLLGPQK